MERINPTKPGIKPFMSFFFETTTPAIERRSAMNGIAGTESASASSNPLIPLTEKNMHKTARHGAATAKISPAMASLLVFL